MSQSSCPLCKRTASASVVGLAPGSRLCDECRSIVQEAFPAPSSRVLDREAGLQSNGAMTLIHQDAPLLDLPQIDSSEFIEHGSSVDSFEHEPEFSRPTLFELDDDLTSDLREGEESDARQYTVEAPHTVEAELADMSQDGSSQARAGMSNHSVEAEPAHTENPDAGEGEFYLPEQAATFTKFVPEDHHTDRPKQSQQAAVNDPWEEPLPSWDYSQSEWPVLMGTPKRNQMGVMRASLVVLVLLAAGGFYFFILQPTLREQRTNAPVDPRAPARAAAVAQPNIAEAKAPEPAPRPVAALPPAEKPATVDPKPIQVPEDGNTHGQFSLQAAAFPNQAAADQFAAKLKQAGVPSYTVSADLGRRGRWFRVRVGRFNSADDAQKFAAEAQLRAKAAGMSVQLIGCQYDQQ